jgi:hypothetical protein
LLACWASHHLSIPVDEELRLGQPIVRAGLPAWIVSDRTDDGHAMLLLAVDQHSGVSVALVDKMLGRQ